MHNSFRKTNTRVIVGMSGGVDSSVAAHILLEQGFSVDGLFMKNWDEDDGTEYCTAASDLADAQAVCDKLGITLHTANFAAEYWDNVFAHFLTEYKAGRTPNPDVLCNREIKFKAFLQYAIELGADMIATGHYVRSRVINESTHLIKGVDTGKDQSYFLCEVTEDCLENTLFPIGGLTKTEVREIALTQGLAVHNKKDSTGICFIGERKFKDFLQGYIPAQPGEIETIEGEVVGTHNGLMYHTIGQRQGLGIGGLKNHNEAPWYVVDKHMERNILVVAQGKSNPRLFTSELLASKPSWVNKDHPSLPLRCTAKIRYRQADQHCVVAASSEASIKVTFDQLQRAVTPGQYIVFYDGDICLGGAIIKQNIRNKL